MYGYVVRRQLGVNDVWTFALDANGLPDPVSSLTPFAGEFISQTSLFVSPDDSLVYEVNTNLGAWVIGKYERNLENGRLARLDGVEQVDITPNSRDLPTNSRTQFLSPSGDSLFVIGSFRPVQLHSFGLEADLDLSLRGGVNAGTGQAHQVHLDLYNNGPALANEVTVQFEYESLAGFGTSMPNFSIFSKDDELQCDVQEQSMRCIVGELAVGKRQSLILEFFSPDAAKILAKATVASLQTDSDTSLNQEELPIRFRDDL